MAIAMKFNALALLVVGTYVCLPTNSIAQVMPYRAMSPACKGKCGSPLCGPCVADTPYAYVPTRWRRWPVTQASATMAPEELPSPTPAKVPSEQRPSPESQVPKLPMTPDLPESSPRGTSSPSSTIVPPLNTTPSTTPSGDNPQVPVFGDEPQAPPSAADPLRSPFNDEPPQPPTDTEETVPGTEPAPSGVTPADALPGTTGVPTPATAPATTAPGAGMPFDVGPPQMPAVDPFADDPNQESPSEPQTGARLEQSYRETYGLARAEVHPMPAASAVEADMAEPRLLRADGRSVDAARLPAETNEPNPLRQVSHPGRRTVATEAVAPPTSNKPVSTWRRNPLRDR